MVADSNGVDIFIYRTPGLSALQRMKVEPYHSQDAPDRFISSNNAKVADCQRAVDSPIQNVEASRGSLSQRHVENAGDGDKAISLPQTKKSMNNSDAGSHSRPGTHSSFLMAPSLGGNWAICSTCTNRCRAILCSIAYVLDFYSSGFH